MADPGLYNAILEENKCLQDSIQEVGLNAALAALAETPWDTTNWSILLPLIDSPIGCLCVYDDSGLLRCGSCCEWTVPGGVTQVQFQLWGAGAGSGIACCCGGAPFGATGAYATVIIPVTPGDTYTLCAGCANCCYSCVGQINNADGCPSFVTGNGLTGFCADGGEGNIACGMCILGSACCRWQNPSCTNSGPCICGNGSHYCGASCATCGVIPFAANPDKTFNGTTSSGAIVYGLSSIFSGGCLDSNTHGYHIHPPLISPCHTVQTNSCCCQTFTSGSCCGGCRCQACDGILCYPGAGGFGTHMMAGATAWRGDAGRGGMVRVTWK